MERMQAAVVNSCEQPLPGDDASDQMIIDRVILRVYAAMPELNKSADIFRLSPELVEAKNTLRSTILNTLASIYPDRFQPDDLTPEERPGRG
jgi:hypothetical protein